MRVFTLLLLASTFSAGLAFIPAFKEHVLPEALLREVVERMGRELEGYLDEPVYPQLRSTGYQENPSIRDQEYLQHSSIWAAPFTNSGETNESGNKDQNGRADGRQDTLPAYCDPPNPCPVGYTGEEGCLEEFENTASFSRDYQSGQDCMCDSEHMFDCSANHNSNTDISRNDLDRLVQQFQAEEGHKNLVAKKNSK